MAGNSTITGPGGTALYVEDIGGSILLPAVKIHTGALGVDGGPMSSTNPLFFQGRTPSLMTLNSLPAAGKLVKSGSGVAYTIFMINTTGGAIFGHVFDATATQSGGAIPLQTTASIATNGQSGSVQLGSAIYGLTFTNGLWAQGSSTLQTMTTIASTSVNGYVLYV